LQIYTGSGKVTIEADWNGSQMLEVTVADTGRGIEPNRLEVVFDRFYQEEGTATYHEWHRSRLSNLPRFKWLGRSDLGFRWQDQGSQFHFTIPIVENTQKQTPSASHSPKEL